MAHSCQALVVACIDFRFHSAIRGFLVDLGLKDNYDFISLAGATKDLIDNDPAGATTIIRQIDISCKLHDVGVMYIIHHMDCGAYGGHAASTSRDEERSRQLTDLETARRIIAGKFPSLDIKKVLANVEVVNGRNKIDFEIIR